MGETTPPPLNLEAVKLLVDVISEIEAAAWAREFTRLCAARVEFEVLTGITLKGQLRRELNREIFLKKRELEHADGR